MNPVLENLKSEGDEFIFATLTIKNCYYKKLSAAIDILLKAYDRLLKRKKIILCCQVSSMKILFVF